MTIPSERTRAVQKAEMLLRELTDLRATQRVPRAVRERAHRILRHFPSTFDLHMSAQRAPDIWGPPWF